MLLDCQRLAEILGLLLDQVLDGKMLLLSPLASIVLAAYKGR